MRAKTADTIWPDTISPCVMDSIETFFQLLDGYTPEAGKQWSELYLPEGKFEAFGQTFTGRESEFNPLNPLLSAYFPGTSVAHTSSGLK
jgi:hypothetical protein